MAFAAQVRTADNVVVGTWTGAGTIPSPPGGADHYMEPLTESEYQTINAAGLFYGNDPDQPRWSFPGGPGNALAETADARPRIVFLEQGTSNVEHTVLRQVGQPDLVLDVAKLEPTGTNVDTSFNGDIRLRVSDGRWVRLPFTNGMSTLTIKADKAKEWQVDQQAAARIAGPRGYIRCRVFAAAEL